MHLIDEKDKERVRSIRGYGKDFRSKIIEA